jgi:hypothetical protein
MKVEYGTLAAREPLGKSEILSGEKEPPPSATYAPNGLARDRTSDCGEQPLHSLPLATE